MSEKSAAGQKNDTAPWILKLNTRVEIIIALLSLLFLVIGCLAFFAANAADVREVRGELARQEIELVNLDARLSAVLTDMNPVLLDIQTRMVRMETQLKMVLESREKP